MTNFDFLLEEKKFSGFANTAITAEKLYQIDLPSCLFNVRRALEFAVKWMYSVDGSLTMPYQDQLVSLINTEEFRDIIDDNLYRRINFIRMLGNNSAHSTKQITPEQAQLALENLFYFLDNKEHKCECLCGIMILIYPSYTAIYSRRWKNG